MANMDKRIEFKIVGRNQAILKLHAIDLGMSFEDLLHLHSSLEDFLAAQIADPRDPLYELFHGTIADEND